MTDLLAFRQTGIADAEPLAAMVADAFDGYRAFAPAWQPPPPEEQLAVFSRWIGDPEYWAELATDGEGIAGFATFIPARRHARLPDPDRALAHLGHLFIGPAHWGSGLATELIGRARRAADARGFSAMRLFVVTGQARARRFYEREAPSPSPSPAPSPAPAEGWRRTVTKAMSAAAATVASAT